MLKLKGNTIITISRAFGSGGREIGKKIAKELGIPFFDKELLEVAAKDGRVSLNDLRAFDEKKVSDFFYSLVLNPYVREGTEPLGLVVQNILADTIKAVANEGPCVIVGRSADKILRDKYDILSVFISAPLEERIARVAKRDGLPEKECRKVILKADRARRAYYNYYDEGEWGEAANYNLCIDSGHLGIDNATKLIIEYLKLNGKLA